MEKYNGWTNYATWRIALEFFDGDDSSMTAEQAKEHVEEFLEVDCDNQLTLSYALAFINDVNWFEIEERLR